ncbi:MAG TPA: hypothetical protein VKB76_10765, partial [Ktedonobacterales bacterium]|nr:hypothetical protein [Ktedonobacterales bacterium]
HTSRTHDRRRLHVGNRGVRDSDLLIFYPLVNEGMDIGLGDYTRLPPGREPGALARPHQKPVAADIEGPSCCT